MTLMRASSAARHEPLPETSDMSDGLDGAARSGSTKLDRWVLERIQRTVATAPVRFELWDGFALPAELDDPIATIVFRNRRALSSWLWNAEVNFGETYMAGTVAIRGDLAAMLDAIYRAWTKSPARPRWRAVPGNTRRTSRANVHHHYDLGN